jgi:hypothetical protein
LSAALALSDKAHASSKNPLGRWYPSPTGVKAIIDQLSEGKSTFGHFQPFAAAADMVAGEGRDVARVLNDVSVAVV